MSNSLAAAAAAMVAAGLESDGADLVNPTSTGSGVAEYCSRSCRGIPARRFSMTGDIVGVR
jgi:hypothetical protein